MSETEKESLEKAVLLRNQVHNIFKCAFSGSATSFWDAYTSLARTLKGSLISDEKNDEQSPTRENNPTQTNHQTTETEGPPTSEYGKTSRFEQVIKSFESQLLNKEFGVIYLSEILNGEKQNVLHAAAAGVNAAVVFCITHELPLHILTKIVNHQDTNGDTPLLIALKTTTDNQNDIESNRSKLMIVKYLISAGASLFISNKQGTYPVHCATDSYDIIHLILKSGALPDVIDKNGFTPLISAIIHDNLQVIQLLLETINLNAYPKSPTIPPPLCFAAAAGKTDITRLLLKHNPNLEELDKHGWTALHCAAEANNLQVVKMLLQAGASPTATNSGRSPADLAAENGAKEVVEYLDSLGYTPTSDPLPPLTVPITEKKKPTDKLSVEERKDVLTRGKEEGNEAHKNGDYSKAVQLYSEALENTEESEDTNELRGTIFSNRSLVYRKMECLHESLEDAKKAVELRPGWFKPHCHMSKALEEMGEFTESAQAMWEAARLSDYSPELLTEVRRLVNEARTKNSGKD